MEHVMIVMTEQGIAAVGTVSPHAAAEAWRRHLALHVRPEEHAEQRLDELDWLRAGRRRLVRTDDDRATVITSRDSSPGVGEDGLVLVGTFRGRRSHARPVAATE